MQRLGRVEEACRLLIEQLADDPGDLRFTHPIDLGRKPEVAVVAELDLWPSPGRCHEGERLALLRLDDLDLGVGERLPLDGPQAATAVDP